MKASVHITANLAGGWDAALEIAGAALPVRTLAECAVGNMRFPLPAAPEWVAPVNTGDKLRALLRGCHGGGASVWDICEFGEYLTVVLFGTRWPDVENAAKDGAVEIELHLPENDAVFSKLPWDLMHVAAVPLAKHPSLTVSVARIIKQRVGAGQARALMLPLRVLFIVGRRLDEQLRPGAEYYAVLRRKRQDKTTQIQTELLMEATFAEIQAAVGRMEPHVVHMISHGDAEPDGDGGVGRLLLTKEEHGRKLTNDFDPCGAQRLLGLLAGNGTGLPHVVILNACHTGDGGAGCPSFAAQLVAGGVAYAVGMTGEVADSACRLFTLGFYEALLAGSASISLAASAGRRKALLGRHGCVAAIEAARPVLCISATEAAAPRKKPPINPEHQTLISVPEIFRKQVVCDRFGILHGWQQFSAVAKHNGQPKAFVISVKSASSSEKLGKSTILNEIAALAVGAGFIPCILRLAGTDRATTPFQLAIDIFEAMLTARENFKLPRPLSSSILDGAIELGLGLSLDTHRLTPGMPRFHAAIGDKRAKLATPKSIKGSTIREMLLEDFAQLAADAKKFIGGEWTPLAMFDDLHLLDGPATMLLEEVFHSAGLGRQGGGADYFPVPVILTCQTPPGAATESAAHETQVGVATQDSIRKFVADSTLVTHIALEKFKDHDAEMAVFQYLLTRAENSAKPEQGPLVISPDFQKPEQRANLLKMIARLTGALGGVPWNFTSHPPFEEAVTICFEVGRLVPANDEQLLENP